MKLQGFGRLKDISGKKYVCIRKAELSKYLEGSSLFNTDYYREKKVDYYYNKNAVIFVVETYRSGLTIVCTPENIESKGFVDVTENEHYTEDNIQNVIVNNAILEGTDGVGKTSTIVALVQEGIVCEDRSEEICKYMLLHVDMKSRCEAYQKYLQYIAPKFVVFLVNNSKKELMARITARGQISEFDEMAYEYNELYRQTYIQMQNYQVGNQLRMVDCTNLTLTEQISKVKACIMEET